MPKQDEKELAEGARGGSGEEVPQDLVPRMRKWIEKYSTEGVKPLLDLIIAVLPMVKEDEQLKELLQLAAWAVLVGKLIGLHESSLENIPFKHELRYIHDTLVHLKDEQEELTKYLKRFRDGEVGSEEQKTLVYIRRRIEHFRSRLLELRRYLNDIKNSCDRADGAYNDECRRFRQESRNALIPWVVCGLGAVYIGYAKEWVSDKKALGLLGVVAGITCLYDMTRLSLANTRIKDLIKRYQTDILYLWNILGDDSSNVEDLLQMLENETSVFGYPTQATDDQ